MRRCGVLRTRYASSVVERARLCIVQFDRGRSSAAYDEIFAAVERELMRYKKSRLPIVVIAKGRRLRFLSHKESMYVVEWMISEIKHIRKTIAFNIWVRKNNIQVI